MHMISKMKPVADDPTTPDIIEGGTRLAIVFSGSPLFSGAAGGAESEIRRWIIENDWLEGIVALPDQLFYNTGISTYFWILTNRKTEDRAGKIALIDARDSFAKMRKSLGDKRKYINDEQIAEITSLYEDAIELAAEESDKRVKVFDREAFGFQRVTVEQPLRRVWQITEDTLDALAESKAFQAWETKEIAADTGLFDRDATSRDNARRAYAVQGPFAKPGELTPLVHGAPPAVVKELVKLAATPDPDAPVITNRKGDPEPDPDLRDQENIPLPAGWLSLDERARHQALVAQADKYLEDEIRPYLPDAWIDHTKTKIGYEIPFTRHFYEYVPPRPVAEIDAELKAVEAEIKDLLGGLVG